MTLAPTYACFGCVDFANNARTKAYVAWACATGKYKGDASIAMAYARTLCECEDDAEDLPWTNPISDGVCWYDSRVPESADFLGVVVTGSTGVFGSGYKREISDALNGGSVLGLPIITGKQMMLTVTLLATSQAGMNYGREWLRRQFEGDQRCASDGTTCASCQGQLLTLRTHCPTDTSLDDGLHSWAAAGAIDGFEPTDDAFPFGRVNCEKASEGTITIATEQRNSYSTNPYNTIEVDTSGTFTALGNCLLLSDAPTLDDVCCPICATGCDPCTTDPGCDCIAPFVLEPEVLTNTAPCFSDPVCRCIAAVAVTDLPAGYETALRVSLRSGMDTANAAFTRFGLRNVVFRVFENPPTSLLPDGGDPETDLIDLPDGLPLPTDLDSYGVITDRLVPCSEIGVSWIPAASELVVDGLSGQTWLKCNGKCVDHSRRVETISGTVFPLKAHCTNLIITVEWDCLNTQQRDAADTILSSMLVEAFLGHVL